MAKSFKVDKLLAKFFPVSAYDLCTVDKIPTLQSLMGPAPEGPVLDIGIGTGYSTYCVFGDRPIVCVDLDEPNLRNFREKFGQVSPGCQPMCVLARASELPFKKGVFRNILCSEVLEHVEDDQAAVFEIGRVLSPSGRIVISVPYNGLGFANFLEVLGVKTVHDFPGPEHHFRSGYDENSMQRLMAAYGLSIEQSAFYLRFFTRIAQDVISFGNILYQRFIHRRRTWTWSEVAEIEGSIAFRLHVFLFPAIRAFSQLDRFLKRTRGFGLVVAITKNVEV